MSESYRINLTPDDNGTFLVTAPGLPEVTTFAEDLARAATRGRDAVLEAIGARMADQRPVPMDNATSEHEGKVLLIVLPALAELKLDLYRAMAADKVNRAELTRRLGWGREQVERLFRLDHASRLDQLEAAAQALGLRLSVELAPAGA